MRPCEGAQGGRPSWPPGRLTLQAGTGRNSSCHCIFLKNSEFKLSAHILGSWEDPWRPLGPQPPSAGLRGPGFSFSWRWFGSRSDLGRPPWPWPGPGPGSGPGLALALALALVLALALALAWPWPALALAPKPPKSRDTLGTPSKSQMSQAVPVSRGALNPSSRQKAAKEALELTGSPERSDPSL